MRLYLSGKITGNENYKDDFAAARAKLENAGYEVCDPAACGLESLSWEAAMKCVIREMLRCNGVALLPNWEESKGAGIEARLARDLGMAVRTVSAWLEGGVMRPPGPSGS